MRRARVKDERQWPTSSSSPPPSLPWPSPLFPHTSSSPSPSGLVAPLWTKSMGITINSVEDAAVAWEVDGADEDGDRHSVVRFASYICHVADVLVSSALVGDEGHRGRAVTSAQLCLAYVTASTATQTCMPRKIHQKILKLNGSCRRNVLMMSLPPKITKYTATMPCGILSMKSDGFSYLVLLEEINSLWDISCLRRSIVCGISVA
ncbi:uncharacterized protein LOC124649657 [Lolium rigidum]|uniref:uncharacterized protein LOC124649657 n=1 Tax=Lolium rigidum TaxID=89674 RepID=UPI001F5C7863|nr:uncharacterized protein LOC124649657 [Lolium rigidum]